MGQTVCRHKSSGGGWGSTPSCEFVEWAPLRNMFVEDLSGLYVVNAVGILLLALLWLFSFTMKLKDYTRSFVMANLAPLSALAVSCLLNPYNYDIYFEIYRPFSILDFDFQQCIKICRSVSILTYRATLPITLLIFQILNLRSSKRRVETSYHDSYFFAVPIFASLYYTLDIFDFWTDATRKITNIIFCIAVQLCLGIITIRNLFCYCSAARASQMSVASVSNACSRMGWSILFTGFTLTPIIFHDHNDMFFYFFRIFNMWKNAYDMETHVKQLVWLCAPLVFSVFALLLLPAYRSILLCSQGYKYKKIDETQVGVQIETDDLANIPGILAQNLIISAATQASVLYPDQKERIPDFEAVLPHPPNVTKFPTSPQIPTFLQPASRSCTCTHGMPIPVHLVSMYSMDQLQLLQRQRSQQIVFRPVVHTPMQTNLVRFASQPNLAAVQTLQPAMSVPQLSVLPQNPFNIQN